MNFLEELAYEWYSNKDGFFVRSNIKINKRLKGGYDGEIDVIALDYNKNELIHIEASMDANKNSTRIERFNKKFNITLDEYNAILKTNATNVRQIAIVGVSKTVINFGNGIEHKCIPNFINEVTESVGKIDPMKAAIPEGYPLLRAIQFSHFYLPNKTKLSK